MNATSHLLCDNPPYHAWMNAGSCAWHHPFQLPVRTCWSSWHMIRVSIGEREARLFEAEKILQLLSHGSSQTCTRSWYTELIPWIHLFGVLCFDPCAMQETRGPGMYKQHSLLAQFPPSCVWEKRNARIHSLSEGGNYIVPKWECS